MTPPYLFLCESALFNGIHTVGGGGFPHVSRWRVPGGVRRCVGKAPPPEADGCFELHSAGHDCSCPLSGKIYAAPGRASLATGEAFASLHSWACELLLDIRRIGAAVGPVPVCWQDASFADGPGRKSRTGFVIMMCV